MYCSIFTLHIKHSAPPSLLSLRHIRNFNNITPPPSVLSGTKHRGTAAPTSTGFSASEQLPAAPQKPKTLVRSCSAQPLELVSSRALDRPFSIRFSFGQMLLASEAAATRTQIEIWDAGCTNFLQGALQLFDSSQLKPGEHPDHPSVL